MEITIAGFGDKWMELQGTFITRPKSKTSKASSTSLPELSPNLLSDASPSHSGTATPITPRVAPRADGAIVHCISVSTYVRSLVLLFLQSLLRTRPDFRMLTSVPPSPSNAVLQARTSHHPSSRRSIVLWLRKRLQLGSNGRAVSLERREELIAEESSGVVEGGMEAGGT